MWWFWCQSNTKEDLNENRRAKIHREISEANAKFSNENIKTIEGQLQLWSKQAENWEGQRENVRKQIEEQVKQWEKENMFEGKKISLEETRTIADIILRSLESVQKIGQIIGTAIVK